MNPELIAILRDNMEDALQILIDNGKETLREQGHVDTGKLERSFEQKIEVTVNGVITGDVLVEDYAEDLDQGVPASQVKFTSKLFNDLLAWSGRKKSGLGETERRKFVTSTIRKAQKTGFPTPGSLKYSKTGKRTGWIGETIKKSEPDIEKVFILTKFFNILIDNVVADVTQAINA